MSEIQTVIPLDADTLGGKTREEFEQEIELIREQNESIKSDNSFKESVTTIVDENTISTVYSDGSKEVTKFDDVNNTILESYYDSNENLVKQIKTIISDDTIMEKELTTNEQ